MRCNYCIFVSFDSGGVWCGLVDLYNVMSGWCSVVVMCISLELLVMIVFVCVISVYVLDNDVCLYRLCMFGVWLVIVCVVVVFFCELSVMICVYGNDWCMMVVSDVKCLGG